MSDVVFPWEQEYDEKEVDWSKSPHGKPIAVRFEPYHDVTVYEDGYENWYYIGD